MLSWISTATDLAHIANRIAHKGLHVDLKATVYVSTVVTRMILHAKSKLYGSSTVLGMHIPSTAARLQSLMT